MVYEGSWSREDIKALELRQGGLDFDAIPRGEWDLVLRKPRFLRVAEHSTGLRKHNHLVRFHDHSSMTVRYIDCRLTVG